MIPLFKPYMPKNLTELNKILYSGALAYGKWGKQFEKELAKYIGNEKLLIVNSFNSAMLVAIATLGLQSGDEVIASPMSCLASNQPFATQNLKIIWADIDPNTGTLNPESVKNSITKNTKAIFHNHHCGYVGYVNEINSIAKEHGLFVIDDAIEAFGSEYFGKRIGNFNTDLTVFSFQTIRTPNTIEGGALSFNNSKLLERAKIIRDYGIDRSIFRDEIGEIRINCDILLPGYGATMSDVNSYIGLKQLENLEEILKKQRYNSVIWDEVLENDKSLNVIKKYEHMLPNYWVYGILTKNKTETILKFRDKGFYASGIHLNNNNYSVFNNKIDLPGVSDFYSKFIALPCGWWFDNLKELHV